MNPVVKNLFADLPHSSEQEEILTLHEEANLRVERIVSNGQASPAGFWYDQEEDEWVILLRGNATLGFEDGTIVELSAGDYLMIERHLKHRVEKASVDALWMAVHYGA